MGEGLLSDIIVEEEMAEILNIATHASIGQQKTLASLLILLITCVRHADVIVLAAENHLVIWKAEAVSIQVTDEDDTNGGRHLGQVSMLSMRGGWLVNFGRAGPRDLAARELGSYYILSVHPVKKIYGESTIH